MSIEKVKAYLDKFSAGGRIRQFPVSSATVPEAAAALHCDEARIAKTMSFASSDGAILVVTAGDMKIDNRKFKDTFHIKAAMLPHSDVEEKTGHAIGGVCPFAVNEGVSVYLDQSLRRCETVFPACGSSNSAIELTIPELEQFSGYTAWVDVCKKQGEAI